MSKAFVGLTLADLEAELDEALRKSGPAETECEGLRGQIAPIKQMLEAANNRASALRDRIASLRREIEQRRTPRAEPTVTDHALLRYIERVHGIDMDTLRRHVLSSTVREAIRLGASTVRHDGLDYKIANNAVVTVTAVKKEGGANKPHRLTRAQRERLSGEHDEFDEIAEVADA